MKYAANILLILLVISISACKPGQLFGPTLTPTSTPTLTSVPTNTPTQTPTITPTPSPTPLPVVLRNLEGMTIHSLCVELIPSSEPGETGTISVSFDDLVAIFGIVGIDVRKSGENCEARMQIYMGETPYSADYSGTTCYTGATALGKISIAMPGNRDLVVPIRGGVSHPYFTMDCPTSPLGAPLKNAAIKGLLGSFSQIWSYDFLTALIRSKQNDPFVTRAERICLDKYTNTSEPVLGCLIAVATKPSSIYQDEGLFILKSKGSAAKSAVPELISVMERLNLYGSGGDDIAETLKAITGQDFGTDATKWRGWWESQQ